MLVAVLVAVALSVRPAWAADDPHIAIVERDFRPLVEVRGRAVEAQTLSQEMADHHLPALSIAVIENGRVAWARAYGYADKVGGVEATTETIFQAGSISKPVAASAAMQMVQEGKLKLDDAINSSLSSWQLPVSTFTSNGPVTLRHLLTHTGGLTVYGFPGYTAGEPVPTIIQVLEGKAPSNTAAVTVVAPPGTTWKYSGGGFTLAQLMMTDADGAPFPTLMHRRVLRRLHMTSSTYEQPLPPSRHDGAVGYRADGAPISGRAHTYPEMAAAGLWTTPTDLARWVIALQDAYAGRSSQLMRPTTAKAMLSPGLGGWGLGVQVEGSGGTLRFSHGGANVGFQAYMVGYLSGGRGVVVMANGDDSLPVIQAATQAVARAYGWEGLEAKSVAPAQLSEGQLQQLIGSYGHGALTILNLENRLWAQPAKGQRMEIVPTAIDRLVNVVTGSEWTIKRDATGRVKAIASAGYTLPRDD